MQFLVAGNIADMYEHVVAAVFRLDEAVAFIDLEELYNPDSHVRSFIWILTQAQSLHADGFRTRQRIGSWPRQSPVYLFWFGAMT